MTSVCNQMRGKSDRRLRSSDVIGWAEPRAVSSVVTHCGNCAHMDSRATPWEHTQEAATPNTNERPHPGGEWGRDDGVARGAWAVV